MEQLTNVDSTNVEQSTSEDSAIETSGGENTSIEESLIEVNGEKLSVDELKKGYMRQSDYTRKTQELSQQRKESERAKLTPEQEAAVDFLRENNFVTKDDIVKFQKEQANANKLNSIISDNPDLKQFEGAISDLARNNPDMAIEDLVVKYGFTSSDKLAKAKQRDIKGNPIRSNQPKSISEMSDAEYKKWKAANGVGNSFGTFS